MLKKLTTPKVNVERREFEERTANFFLAIVAPALCDTKCTGTCGTDPDLDFHVYVPAFYKVD